MNKLFKILTATIALSAILITGSVFGTQAASASGPAQDPCPCIDVPEPDEGFGPMVEHVDAMFVDPMVVDRGTYKSKVNRQCVSRFVDIDMFAASNARVEQLQGNMPAGWNGNPEPTTHRSEESSMTRTSIEVCSVSWVEASFRVLLGGGH